MKPLVSNSSSIFLCLKDEREIFPLKEIHEKGGPALRWAILEPPTLYQALMPWTCFPFNICICLKKLLKTIKKTPWSLSKHCTGQETQRTLELTLFDQVSNLEKTQASYYTIQSGLAHLQIYAFIVKENFTAANFDTLPRAEKLGFLS